MKFHSKFQFLKTFSVFVVCRRGNDSQIAAHHLQKMGSEKTIKDIIGGLHAWTKQIDPNFPIY